MKVTGWRLASLIGAALIGGYALAAAFGIFIAAVLALPRSETALIGNMASFAIYTGAIIWAFAVRKPLYAWLGLLVPAGLFFLVSLMAGAYGV